MSAPSPTAAPLPPLAADMRAVADARLEECRKAVAPIAERICIRTWARIRAAAERMAYVLHIIIWDWQFARDGLERPFHRYDLQNLNDTRDLDEFRREEVRRQVMRKLAESGYACGDEECDNSDGRLWIRISWARAAESPDGHRTQ